MYRGAALLSPVSLAVYGESFLAQLDQGPEDGLVAVRMVLHGLSHDVRHLGEGAVVHPVHGVQDPSLHRLQAVNYVRYSPLQDNVR